MLICIKKKNVITSCSVTMMLFLHLEVKPLMTLTTVLYLSCALISGHRAMMLMEVNERRTDSCLVVFNRLRFILCRVSWFLSMALCLLLLFFFFQAEDGIRDVAVTGVQTCALPIFPLRSVQRRLSQRGVKDFLRFAQVAQH